MKGPGMASVVELRDLRVVLGGQAVLEGITFGVRPGTVVGVVGPNGGGKTTLLRTILGLIKPSAGEARVFGVAATALRHRKNWIGYVPQKFQFDRRFPASVFDVAMMARASSSIPWRSLPAGEREEAWRNLELMGLGGLEHATVGELSVGQQQRVLLARALTRRARLLLLDEPVAGLDAAGQAGLFDLLDRLREAGLTVVLVSHDLCTLPAHADELVCINRTMHVHGDPAEVAASPKLRQMYRCEFDLLLAARRGGDEG